MVKRNFTAPILRGSLRRQQGDVEEVISLVKQEMERDHKTGTLWFLIISWLFYRDGDIESARRCLYEIIQWWQGKNLEKIGVGGFEIDRLQVWMGTFLISRLINLKEAIDVAVLILGDEGLRKLAKMCIESGKFEEATKIAENMENAEYQLNFLKDIFEEMLGRRNLDKALEVAEKIKDANKRFEALSKIVKEMLFSEQNVSGNREKIEQAMKIVEKIDDKGYKLRTLVEIAKKMLKIGEFDEAIKIIEEIENPMWRSEIFAKIVVRELLESENFDKAIEVARGIEDIKWRSNALSKIAKKMSLTGNEKEAKGIFEEAVNNVKEVKDLMKSMEILREIVSDMIEAGKYKEVVVAVETIMGTIEDIRWCSIALREIAIQMAEAGRFEEAIKIAENIYDPHESVEAFRVIASKMRKAGKEEEETVEVYKKLTMAVKEIKDAWDRSWLFGDLAREMIEEGKIEKAIEFSLDIEDEIERFEVFEIIAKKMKEKNKMKGVEVISGEALDLAKLIEDKDKRLYALWKIINEIVLLRDFEEAISAVRKINDLNDKVELLAAISRSMIRAGYRERGEEVFEEAIKIAGRVEEKPKRSALLGRIAEIIKEVNLKKAIEVIEKIDDLEEKSWMLVEIARSMLETEREENTDEVFKDLIETAEKIEDESKRLWILAKIIDVMVKMKQFEKAIEMVKKILDTDLRADTFSIIADRVLETGRFDEAVKVAEKIEDRKKKSKMFREIARKLLESGEFEKAMEIAGKIENAGWRSEIFRDVAKGIARTGKFDEALGVAEKIEISGFRFSALSEIAKEMTKAGLFEEAMGLLEKIKSEMRIQKR